MYNKWAEIPKTPVRLETREEEYQAGQEVAAERV